MGTLSQKGNLMLSGINRIEDERIAAAEDLIGGLLREESLNDAYRTLRVDLSNSGRKYLGF
jgi:hypothetical protein